MKHAAIEGMELGNLMFGNSRGEYAVGPRKDYQEPFNRFLNALGLDYHGEDERGYGIDNDVFTIRPYYWGEDEAKAELPNFVYKPTGLEISWYKYPMRDAYSNQDVSVKEFKTILKDCLRHVLPELWHEDERRQD